MSVCVYVTGVLCEQTQSTAFDKGLRMQWAIHPPPNLCVCRTVAMLGNEL